ncbi:MAG TPA: hypothetical protein VGR78_14740 [Verrucomicrobiae bacterium]|jgi:hypothetical protein|nr:hypothetical protein [Verrucomicrobiae bacterium]
MIIIALVVLLWLMLFLLFWPLALVALILIPLVWVLSIPFRIVFWIIQAVLCLIKAILFLPARLLGAGSRT